MANAEFWNWVVKTGLIEGDADYYSSGRAAAEPGAYSHAVTTAFDATAPESKERKELIDRLIAMGAIKGDAQYWYEATKATLGADYANLENAATKFFGGAPAEVDSTTGDTSTTTAPDRPALKQGAKGDDVKELQEKLNAAGMQPPLVVDGVYGPKTAEAVKWYQEKNGLTVDGVAGSEVWGSLDGTTSGVPGAKTVGTKDSYTGGDDRFHGLGGAPEIWYNSTTGDSYVVYFVPGFDPPVPMIWKVTKEEDLQAFFGKDQEIIYDRVLTDAEITSVGAHEHEFNPHQGVATEIDITEGDPFEGLVDKWAREAETRPYLLDPEVAALIAASALEGSVPSRAELQGTWYFQHHSQEQIDWIIKEAADPIGAVKEKDANRRYVRQAMISAGILSPDDRLINYIADRYTTGLWSETKMTDQINAVADPYYDAPLDVGLSNLISDPDSGITIDFTTDKEAWVEETVRKWLGPVYGVLSEQQVKDVAGRLRNDPNYEEDWVAGLKAQRMTLFPGYTDIDSSYDEIAQPWRSVWYGILGQDADELSTVFQDALQGNDLTQAKNDIRMYGLTSGNTKVVGDFGSDMFRIFKGNTRGLIE